MSFVGSVAEKYNINGIGIGLFPGALIREI
jgi:hypothetical protein